MMPSKGYQVEIDQAGVVFHAKNPGHGTLRKSPALSAATVEAMPCKRSATPKAHSIRDLSAWRGIWDGRLGVELKKSAQWFPANPEVFSGF